MPAGATAASATSSRSSRSRRSPKTLMHQPQQTLAIQILVQRAFAGGCDRSIFFGDHDYQGVALLAEAEGGAVTRPVRQLRIGRGSQRQKCSGRQRAIAANDHGAVVQ